MIVGMDFYRELQSVDPQSVNPLSADCKNSRNVDPCENLGVYCLGGPSDNRPRDCKVSGGKSLECRFPKTSQTVDLDCM